MSTIENVFIMLVAIVLVVGTFAVASGESKINSCLYDDEHIILTIKCQHPLYDDDDNILADVSYNFIGNDHNGIVENELVGHMVCLQENCEVIERIEVTDGSIDFTSVSSIVSSMMKLIREDDGKFTNVEIVYD